MGRYDNISDARLRYEVQRFARILQRMEEDGETLDRTADILTLLGELRRMVFAWEVRCTFQGDEGVDGGPEETAADDAPDPASETDSERIVREALEQESDFLSGLDDRPEDASDEEDEDGTDAG
jgi:hypothetical protein